jgi:hypothetical protein
MKSDGYTAQPLLAARGGGGTHHSVTGEAVGREPILAEAHRVVPVRGPRSRAIMTACGSAGCGWYEKCGRVTWLCARLTCPLLTRAQRAMSQSGVLPRRAGLLPVDQNLEKEYEKEDREENLKKVQLCLIKFDPEV